jgi:hypothetical protein
VVVGVEPERLDHGDGLSPAVAAALDTVTELVTHLVRGQVGARNDVGVRVL